METSGNPKYQNEARSIHDETLSKIFEAENRSVSKFFDTVFGYFFRNSPELVYDSSKYYGKQVVTSSYDKWQDKYLKTSNSPMNSCKRARNESPPVEKQSSPMEGENACWQDAPNPGGPTHTTNTATVSKRSEVNNTVLTGSKKEKGSKEDKIALDTVNGAKLDNYSWTQTVDDLEVRIPVEKFILRGNQVKVKIDKKHLKVEVRKEENSSEFACVIDGELFQSVRMEDSVWLLSPKQHISILFEKAKNVWWDRFLITETPIDLTKINAEMDFTSLPEEERKQIEKVISDIQKKDRGEPTSNQAKMETMLRKAWDVEGSPFRGQPFDPSLVKVVNDSS